MTHKKKKNLLSWWGRSALASKSCVDRGGGGGGGDRSVILVTLCAVYTCVVELMPIVCYGYKRIIEAINRKRGRSLYQMAHAQLRVVGSVRHH